MNFHEFDFIDSNKFNGKIILTSFPGLNNEGRFDDTLFLLQLNLFKNNNCSSIVSFVEDKEFEKLSGKKYFVKKVYENKLNWYHLPISDLNAPNQEFKQKWEITKVLLKNELLDGIEGGLTLDFTTGKTTSVYEASQNYLREGIPTIVLAGIDYGMGSSRDWAAKGPFLLGVKAVIAKNFERIHRSNLIGMGILPLEYLAGEDSKALGISGFETFDITIDEALEPGSVIPIQATHDDGKITLFDAVCRIDTPVELDYYRNGGILQTVLRSRLDKKAVKGA